ncbi:MAG: diguanylate cyclase [Fuerstiella sp.]
MNRLSITSRITLGLVCLTTSLVLVAGILGLIPNLPASELENRRKFAEAFAVTFVPLATRANEEQLESTLEQVRSRNPQLTSIAIRRGNGRLILKCGSHPEKQTEVLASAHTSVNIVPLSAEASNWGQLEMIWQAPATAIPGVPLRPDITLTLFIAGGAAIGFTIFLRRVLSQLSPDKVVPGRVREALDSLAEGLLVLDSQLKIVLANQSFSDVVGLQPVDIIGKNVSYFNFQTVSDDVAAPFPWAITAGSGEPQKSTLLTLPCANESRTFSVSTVPVKDDKGTNRGVVASFEDVTGMQKKQAALKDALVHLKSSTEEIRKQNTELEWLATRDTLTGCMNRRSFFGAYERYWREAEAGSTPLSAMMVDIDFFKAINDNHGHGMGDEVLRVISRALMDTVTSTNLVCRYGGEEFTVLMPGLDLDEAELLAERCRLAIQAQKFPELKVTASLGVSAICQGPADPQGLLDQADKCLYVAKRNGRNRVIRWDNAAAQIAELSNEEAPTRVDEMKQRDASAIPFHAVAALTSALFHRDRESAIHSRRVADLCVATAEGLLSMRECYVLEIAAMLHDIGKIGIADSILKKPGPLTEDELEAVHQYNRLGVEMVQGSFGSPVLTEIVENHVVFFDMSNSERGAGPDHRPSIGARVLNIANAFDTMVTPSAYRQPLTTKAAFEELRRCAGSQFDPELVEQFINVISSRQHVHEAASVVISKESALSIGLLLEHLVTALDENDSNRLLDTSESLQVIAVTHGLDNIARHSKLLRDTIEHTSDGVEVTQLAVELLDMCRSTQGTLIADHRAITSVGV